MSASGHLRTLAHGFTLTLERPFNPNSGLMWRCHVCFDLATTA